MYVCSLRVLRVTVNRDFLEPGSRNVHSSYNVSDHFDLSVAIAWWAYNSWVLSRLREGLDEGLLQPRGGVIKSTSVAANRAYVHEILSTVVIGNPSLASLIKNDL